MIFLSIILVLFIETDLLLFWTLGTGLKELNPSIVLFAITTGNENKALVWSELYLFLIGVKSKRLTIYKTSEDPRVSTLQLFWFCRGAGLEVL